MRPKRTRQSLILWVPLFLLLACGSGGGSQGQSGARGTEAAGARARKRRAPNPEATGAPAPRPAGVSVRPGLEVLLSDSLHLLHGLRVGLITNHTGIDSRGVSSIDRLVAEPSIDLVALFSPEHGIRGEGLGGQKISSGIDGPTGLPIHSLYGETRKPTPEMLQGLQALLFDIQDVGARYYTYVSTMAKAMEAAGEAGIPFFVLDRPNPIGGVAVQGNVLDPAFSSFVGLFPVPMRHGMTPGELARLYVGAFGVEVELHVIPMDGWSREMLFSDTGLPWVRLSRNMPSLASALEYPGMCLFDGTNVSVGRGTDLAFQVLGAPWLDGEAIVASMLRYRLPGVRFEPVRFTPMDPEYGKFTGQEIGGVRLVYLSPDYDPTVTALALLGEIRRMSGDQWSWRDATFDGLAGTDRLRKGIDAGLGLPDLTEGWQEKLEAFRRLREPYLLY